MRVNEMKFSGQRHTITYEHTGEVEIGDAVVITTGGTVARGAGAPVGIVTAVEDDGHVTVLLYGEVVTAKTPSALSVGYQLVRSDAQGRLVAAGEDPGRPAIVHTATTNEAAVTLL